MIAVYTLIFIPILLFVVAFLYETYLSIIRLKSTKKERGDYVSATWEVTNTLLIFGVVMLLMLFTKSIDVIASAVLLPTLLAGGALLLRAICYIYIFYVREKPQVSAVDYVFALSHVAAAGLLVITVLKATIILFSKHPEANVQFVPVFIPGLVVVIALCAVPIFVLYTTKTK